MLASIAIAVLALQFGGPLRSLDEGNSFAQEIRYRRAGHPPPCGDGYDLDQRDGLCYGNGIVPPQFQSGRYYPLEYGGGRRPVPCGHRADVDIRDGLCYPTGTVPRRFQAGRQGYHYRRDGYYEMR